MEYVYYSEVSNSIFIEHMPPHSLLKLASFLGLKFIFLGEL